MTIVYILAAILIFGILIAVHEFGHFAAAKLCGVRVNEFSIGMGPLIWHKETAETQYSLRLLPIGGFCAMEGEDEDSSDERSLGRQGFFKKLVIFAAGSFCLIISNISLLVVPSSFANSLTFIHTTSIYIQYPCHRLCEPGILHRQRSPKLLSHGMTKFLLRTEQINRNLIVSTHVPEHLFCILRSVPGNNDQRRLTGLYGFFRGKLSAFCFPGFRRKT